MEILKVKDQVYTLKLKAKNVIQVEKRLGKSIFEALGTPDAKGEVKLPSFEDLSVLLWGCIQNEKNITYEEVLPIIDDYMEEGGSFLGLFQILAAAMGFTKPTK